MGSQVCCPFLGYQAFLPLLLQQASLAFTIPACRLLSCRYTCSVVLQSQIISRNLMRYFLFFLLLLGSPHICFGQLSSSTEQFYQLPSWPRSALSPTTRTAPPAGLAIKYFICLKSTLGWLSRQTTDFHCNVLTVIIMNTNM